MSAWEEAFDEASQRSYFFNRLTGETSWTPPGEATSESADSTIQHGWQRAFDEASQTAYYYNADTGETSWTLPEAETEEDLSYLVFAVVRLQSIFRGARDRRRAIRLVKTQYQTTKDPVSGQTLYTNLKTNTSSWTKPVLFNALGVDDDAEDEEEDDDANFEDFHMDIEQGVDEDDEEEDPGNNDDESGEGRGKDVKSRRKYPRSEAQQRVDAVENEGKEGTELDFSGLNAWKLSSRIWNLRYLKVLILSKNQLQRIPSGIQDLMNLEELDMSYNHLTRLPSCLQTIISWLQDLKCDHNRLQPLPLAIGHLTELLHLNASFNALDTLPTSMMELKALASLYANDNALKHPPPAMQHSSCFCDYSNNPFNDDKKQVIARRALYANVMRFLHEKQFAESEALFTELLRDVDTLRHEGQKTQRPELHFARGVAREKHQEYAAGTIVDFQVAIQHGAAELSTAHYMVGLTHMARMEHVDAIASFTEALKLVVPREQTDDEKDNNYAHRDHHAKYLLRQPVPAGAVHIFLKRAEAYRLVGQLPAALTDVRHVLTHQSMAMQAVEDAEKKYADEWEVLQREYFVDQETLFLCRQAASVDAHGDFKREIRENLQLEMEEAQQRAVEAELARRAELTRLELEREFNERLYMKYEDELMQWLIAEELRLERERQWRLEEAQRKAETKAAYATRLARRGGRRQQGALQRGTGNSSSGTRGSSRNPTSSSSPSFNRSSAASTPATQRLPPESREVNRK
ncbi:Formaldehyde dehydrogenase adha, partial [Globisporangium splendens]